MIDPDVLRSLGWKEELIDEVTRIASKINDQMPRLPAIANTASSGSALASREFFADSVGALAVSRSILGASRKT